MTKKKKPEASKTLPGRSEIRRLWRVIQVPEWLALFQELAPALRWEMSGQSSIKSCCPYHEDNSPSFHLSFVKRMGKCYGDTCEKLVTDLIALVAKLRNCNYTEALLFLNERLNLGDKLVIDTDELNKYNNIQELKKQTAVAANKVLVEMLRDCPAHLEYCWPALVYLTDVRNLPTATLHTLPVGVFAKPLHLKQYIPETLHALFDEYFAKYQSAAFWGGLLFHYNDSPGTITRFKLRLRDTSIPEAAPTKVNVEALNNVDKTRLYKREYAYIEDPYTERFGLYGLHKYHRMIGRNDADAYVTEGEFDVLSVMAAQDANFSSEFMILGTGGKGSTSVGFLREFGIRSCWLVPDHPAKNGDSWAISVLADKTNYVTNGDYARPLDFKVFQWPAAIEGMDLDEAVRKSGYAQMVDALFKQREHNFKNVFRWIKSRADAELDATKRTFNTRIDALDPDDENVTNQRESLIDEKRKALFDALVKWYRYLHDQTDRLAFTQDYEAAEGLDLSQIEEVNKQIKGLDTLEGVVSFISDALKEKFEVCYYVKKTNETQVYAWAKKNRELIQLFNTERNLAPVLSLMLGRDYVGWVTELLGKNDILYEGTEKLPPLKASNLVCKNAYTLIERALCTLSCKVPDKASLITIGQGIHYANLPHRYEEKPPIYFVNGNRVFKGHFDEDDVPTWQEIGSNVDAGFLLTDLSNKESWSSVTDIDEVRSGPALDPNKTFEMLMEILHGWKLEHEDVMIPYLSAYIMSLPIMVATGNVTITYVVGEKESGKTALVNGLLGGSCCHKGSFRPVLESAKATFDITAAGMYQYFNDKTLTLVVDEAEVSGKHTTKHDQKILEIIRMVYGLPMGGVSIDRGGITSDQRVSYRLVMPVILAAINMPQDKVFLSRIMMVSTQKDPGRENPLDRMVSLYSPEKLEDLRKSVTIGLLADLPKIMAIRDKLKKELSGVGHGITAASNRFLDTLLTPLSVYAFLGKDPAELYLEILRRNKFRLDSIHGDEIENELLNACLFRERIEVRNEDMRSTYQSARTSILNGEINHLNNCDCGLYYLEKFGWIVIVWRHIKHTILDRTQYTNMQECDLKDLAARNPLVINPITTEQHTQIMHHLVLKDVSGPADYTVVSSSYLLKSSPPEKIDDLTVPITALPFSMD
jgi:hypothetical protein